MDIVEVQLVSTNGPVCAHSGGARLCATLIGESVEWSGLGRAGTKRSTIGRNGVLVGCIREYPASFSIRADARGGHYWASVGRT